MSLVSQGLNSYFNPLCILDPRVCRVTLDFEFSFPALLRSLLHGMPSVFRTPCMTVHENLFPPWDEPVTLFGRTGGFSHRWVHMATGTGDPLGVGFSPLW